MNFKLLVISSAIFLSPIVANATCGANHGKGHVHEAKGDKAHGHACKTVDGKAADCGKTAKDGKSTQGNSTPKH